MPYVFTGSDRVRGNSFGYNLHVVGRLRDGVSVEQAQARTDQITATIASELPSPDSSPHCSRPVAQRRWTL